MNGRILVIVPTLDECTNVPLLVERLLGLGLPGCEILVVDDGSTDGTRDVVRELGAADPRVRLLERDGPKGLGLAYVAGFGQALADGFDRVVAMDADLSHDPADVPRLVAACRDHDAAIGSRYVAGGRLDGWPLDRRALSLFANWYARNIARLPVRDCTSGFKCLRADALEAISVSSIHSSGYAFQIELHHRLARAGLKLVEVPISFRDRVHGTSKLGMGDIGEAVRLPWRLRRSGP